MNNYKWENRDFTELDNNVDEFNKLPRVGTIDNFNRRIDLDYISNSDEIEGISPEKFLQDILKNNNLKVLRSYPKLVVNRKDVEKGQISDRVTNVSGMDKDDQEDVYKDLLRDTELVVFDTETGEESHVKTTGHLLAVAEVIKQARLAKMFKNTTGEDIDLTAEFIADNINCHILGEPFGRYRSPWYCPVARITGVDDWCIPGGRKVDEEIESLLDWYNNGSKDLHPIERAAILHIEFIRIHPFADGNGRTGRLLVNYELVKNGYPTITIKASQRGEYIDAINRAITTGDATMMVDLIKRRMESRLRLYKEILAEDGMVK